jgi:hypothetical protein
MKQEEKKPLQSKSLPQYGALNANEEKKEKNKTSTSYYELPSDAKHTIVLYAVKKNNIFSTLTEDKQEEIALETIQDPNNIDIKFEYQENLEDQKKEEKFNPCLCTETLIHCACAPAEYCTPPPSTEVCYLYNIDDGTEIVVPKLNLTECCQALCATGLGIGGVGVATTLLPFSLFADGVRYCNQTKKKDRELNQFKELFEISSQAPPKSQRMR